MKLSLTVKLTYTADQVSEPYKKLFRRISFVFLIFQHQIAEQLLHHVEENVLVVDEDTQYSVGIILAAVLLVQDLGNFPFYIFYSRIQTRLVIALGHHC